MPENEMHFENAVPVVVTQNDCSDYGSVIPDYAIERMAKFLLPRLQADLESAQLHTSADAV